MKEVCVCAAILASNGSVYRGHRHGDCLRAMKNEDVEIEGSTQGFVTTRNRFVTREEGRKLQEAAGIPSADKNGYRGNTLFSEDLYQSGNDVIINRLNSEDKQN